MLYEFFLEIYLFISWYCNLFNIRIPLIAIFFVIVTSIVLRIIMYVFPFLNRFADVLTHPFRSARFVIRVNTAYKLENELKEEQSYQQAYLSQSDTELDRIEFGVYNRLEVNSQLDGSNVYFSSTRLEDNIQVAMASGKTFVIVLGGYIAIFPLLLQTNPAYAYFIHCYFALVLCHVIIPRGGDFEMVFYATVRKGLVRNFLMYWMIFGFFGLFLAVTLISGGNVLLALIIALLSVEQYHILILPLVHLSRWWKERVQPKYPELGEIPDSDIPDHKSPGQSPLLSFSVHNDMNYD